MQFVSEHLTKHHLVHTPHRWLAALILSPLHAGEMHYKQKYHLKFVHAKKLFLFDLALIVWTIFLFVVTIVWFTYDPTITKYVDLTIAPMVHDASNTDYRVRSGEHVAYIVSYANNSDLTLEEATLRLNLPSGFLLETGTRITPLGDVAPGAEGVIQVSGFFFEDHEFEQHITASLEYTQEDRGFKEQKLATVIQVLRGSVLENQLTIPDQLLAQGSTPLSLSLTNGNHHTIEKIQVPLTPGNGFQLTNIAVSQGTIENGIWTLTTLTEGETETLTATLVTNITARDNVQTFSLTPELIVEERRIKQTPAEQSITILRPEIATTATWASTEPLLPGDTRDIILSGTNNGTVSLESVQVTFEIPTGVDPDGLVLANGGSYRGTQYTVAAVQSLSPGASFTLPLTIPLKTGIYQGTDLTLSIAPQTTATVPAIANQQYQSGIGPASDGILVGTSAFLRAETRYYTAEGDQLGRGPLPPQVGEETKYWAFISLQNTTSRIINMSFTAQLPEGVSWTGRSSVSHGQGLEYGSTSRTVAWSSNRLNPHNTLGLFMELSLTPTAAQRGTQPDLLTNIQFTGEDGHTNLPISRSHGAIDISLPNDDIGKAKGTVVQ